MNVLGIVLAVFIYIIKNIININMFPEHVIDSDSLWIRKEARFIIMDQILQMFEHLCFGASR